MGVTIRQAGMADAAALAELAALTFPLACPSSSPAEDIQSFIAERLNATVFAAYLGDPHRAVFVAAEAVPEGGERLLAYTMLVDAPPSDADVAAVVATPRAVELSKCYAHPDCHGGGVPARIMAASLDWAAALGAPQVWLGVNSENAKARTFYEKHGFSIAGNRSFQLGNQVEHDFVMVRPA
ncbi:MAG: GNAT family N-acetyltransferase [Specibacter sp.]